MALDTTAEKVPSQIQRGGIVDEEAQRSSQSIEDFKLKDEGAESDTPTVESESSGTPIDQLDWDSPEDPGNPQLWSTWKKVFHTAIPALIGFVLTVGTSSYVPALALVMKKFDVSREVAVLPLSLYTLGFCLGPSFAAPLSEMYGRRIVYWTTMPLLLIFTAIAASVNNIPQLIIFRLLAGTIADMWNHHQRGRAALFFILSPFLGPSLGPLIGAYIIAEYNENWRFSLWVIMFIAAPILVASLFMQETYKPRILYLRHKARGEKIPHKTGDTRLLLRKLRTAFLRPINMMLFEPLVAFLSIYTGFAFAMMFSFFGSYSYVFSSVYGFNNRQIGLTFLGLLIGFLFAVASFGIFDATLYRKAAKRANGRPAPEHRLYAALLGSILLPIGLFWFAWAPSHSVHWIVPVLAGIPFGWGCLSIFISATTYLVDVLPSCEWCECGRCEWDFAVWVGCGVSTIYATDVRAYGDSLGGERICVCGIGDDACAVGVLVEGEGVEGEEFV
ncbi:Polyamine transporter [Lachnellula subtilissima]|uniref:Polyamine transporter n=1 Tax=Lachnellula subtilissima TaxID=602034 RepID=A0A8H8U9V9_9HELO|nr:Polyamine transporter [Lachnellula subtilissima]